MERLFDYCISIHMPGCKNADFGINGIEAAWDAYHAAKEFGELIGADNVMLTDLAAGEIIADVFDD